VYNPLAAQRPFELDQPDTGEKMENPTMSEFLFEVTRLEDIAEELVDKELVNNEEGAKLGDAAEGFRTLADEPARYGVADDNYRQWAQTLDNELNLIETRVGEPNGSPNSAVNELIESIWTQLSDSQKEAFGKSLF
jgi:hypothetical protein